MPDAGKAGKMHSSRRRVLLFMVIQIACALQPEVKELANEAESLLAAGKGNLAAEKFDKAVSLQKGLNAKSPEYAEIKRRHAEILEAIGEHAEAVAQATEAAELHAAISGSEENISMGPFLLIKAKAQHNVGQYMDSVSSYRQVLAIQKKVLGEKHTEYALTQVLLASAYTTMGLPTEARNLLEAAIEVLKNSRDEISYALALAALGKVFYNEERWKDAVPLYKDALKILKEKLGEKDEEYLRVTNDLVSLYYHMGDFGEVVPLYERHMERTREAFGEDHVAYLHIKRNLEMVNQYLGKQALGQAGSAQPVITQSMSDECRPGDQHCTPKSTAPAAVPR